MKEFDLDAALNGEPVKLRNGNKAFICYKLSRDFKYWDGSPINFNRCGYILNFNGDITMLNTAWKEDGKWTMDETKSDRDIIAMWEEPKLTQEELFEKALKERLPLCYKGLSEDCADVYVVAKSMSDDYILEWKDGTGSCVSLLSDLPKFEWYLASKKPVKEKVIAVDLPKPFKPKDGEIYYYIHPHETNFYLDVHETTCSNCRFDEILSDTGNCFRTRKDAQKWLDFMKSMME